MIDRIKKEISFQLDVGIEEITMDADFVEDLGADSLDMMEMMMNFEEETGLEFPDDFRPKNLQEVMDYLEKNG